jgi:hypothetical protein
MIEYQAASHSNFASDHKMSTKLTEKLQSRKEHDKRRAGMQKRDEATSCSEGATDIQAAS